MRDEVVLGMWLTLLACHHDPETHDTGTPIDGALLGRGIAASDGAMWVSGPRIDGSGSVVRFGGLDPTPAATLTADGPIGDAVATCGDLVLVGGPTVGSRGGTWWFADPTEPASFVEGLRDDGHAGTMVACGDLDGDGATDVATSAPDSDGIGLARLGGTIELFDRDRGKVGSLESTWDQSHLGFRSSVALRDDLDGDGIADLVAGGYGVDQVNVWSGPVVGSGDTNQAQTFDGIKGDGTGYAVATGDVDGDGANDLVVGAPNGAGGRGGVWVVLGPMDGQDRRLLGYDRAHLVPGAGTVDQAGFSVAVVGGAVGWLTGSPGAGGVGPEAGAAWLVAGSGMTLDTLDHADAVIIGTQAGGKLGWAVAGTDLDGDGVPELVVSAPETDVGSVRGAGSVFVFPGSTRGRVQADQALLRIDGS